MKNLNVKLAENFNVEFTNVGFDEMGEGTTEDDYDALLSHAELFIADLAKKNIFPETDDVICIDNNFSGQLTLNFSIDKARFIYDFNTCAELESLRIEDLFLAI